VLENRDYKKKKQGECVAVRYQLVFAEQCRNRSLATKPGLSSRNAI
jgi:hypothetical protein